MSILNLVYKRKYILLKTDGKNYDIDYFVPSILWVYLQLYPSHDNRNTE